MAEISPNFWVTYFFHGNYDKIGLGYILDDLQQTYLVTLVKLPTEGDQIRRIKKKHFCGQVLGVLNKHTNNASQVNYTQRY
jgi:hypothetical protein